MRQLLLALSVVCAGFASAPGVAAQALSAEMFARDPAITSISLSPNGQYVAMIQRVGQDEALAIVDWRAGEARGIQVARRSDGQFLDWVRWKNDGRLLFSMHRRLHWDGTPEDRSWEVLRRVFAVDRSGANVTQMFEGQMRRLAAADYAPISLVDIMLNDPDEVVLGTWGQNGYTLYRANVNTGRADVIDDDSGWETVEMMVDGAGNAVMRTQWLPNNSGYQFFRRAPGERNWTLAHEVRRSTVAQNRAFDPLGPGPGAGQVYVAARPEGQEFQAIYLYDTRTGELGEPAYAHPNADAAVLRLDPNDNSMLAGCGETQRMQCRARDPLMQRHFDAIGAYFDGQADFVLRDVSVDKNIWLIVAEGPTIPWTAYVYDLNARQLTALGSRYPHILRTQLEPSEIVTYTARDGTELWGYLTRPANAEGAQPLVVMPHGGPESRDSFQFDLIVQFFATRGYSVFQPNFRGSEGSGYSFAQAGHRQWGRRMQDDVTDGVRHLIEAGRADAGRICIVGASYGGYAALAGGAFTPELYRCVVAIAPDADLVQMLDEERRQQGRNSVGYAYWATIVGDANRDQAELIAMSPARHAENFRAPVLLIHGSADWIVRVEQSEVMHRALQRAGREVRFVRVEDEDHYLLWWERPNRQRLFEEMEQFLAAHLGGPR